MKTRILRDGDKGRAICEDCRARVTTTYRRRDVPMSDGSGLVRNVLVGVCDTCDTIVSLPQQSVPMVKAVVKRKRTSVEARVPVHVRDMLAMVSDAMGHGPGFDQHIVRFYISEWAEKGVRVNAIAPTYINTDATAFIKNDKKMFKTWMEMSPIKRLGKTSEIASIALFLASEASSLITGSIVLADGGYTSL